MPPATRGLAPVRVQLGNGTVILAKETRTTPAVTIHASVRAGIIYDPPGAPGTAHFVSRTLDRGTGSRSADQLAEELDNRGVSLTVSVNRHVITVVCTCLTDDFDAMLDLVGDVVMCPAFPDREVDTKRSEIVTLIRQDEDSPASVAAEALLALLFGADHPYGRRPRGSAESVLAITPDALRRFHAGRFAPSTLSLAIVGDVDAQRAVDAAARVFSPWSRPQPEEPVLTSPGVPGARRVRVHPMMNKAQADIAYGFQAVGRHDPDYDAYWLMNNILGQYSLGGRLGDSIRERQGMAYYVFSALDANVIPGPLMIRAGVNPSNVDRAIASIDQELATLAREGPTEKELAESTQYLIGSMPRTLETNTGIATFLQTSEFFGLGLDYDVRVPDLLRGVTRDAVHQAARRTLDITRASVVIAGPYSGESR